MIPLAIAHRAGNSLAGLHAANALGADVIEADVHHHRGSLEVRHLKTAGPLPFLWDRWELASARAPRLGLAELLRADRHGTTFMLDLKSRDIEVGRTVATLLRESTGDHPVLACGRYWPAVLALAELPRVRPVLSARNRVEVRAILAKLRSGPVPYGVSVHRSLLDRDTVSALRARVEMVMTWPVNDLESARSLLSRGVTGIITDEPEVLRWVIEHRNTDAGLVRGDGSG